MWQVRCEQDHHAESVAALLVVKPGSSLGTDGPPPHGEMHQIATSHRRVHEWTHREPVSHT